MSKFKVGDRVIAIDLVDGTSTLKGKIGTVIAKPSLSSYDVSVEFDESFLAGHNGDGIGKLGHCRYGFNREFKLLERDWDE